MLYYTNLLDSVLFDATFSGHKYVDINFKESKHLNYRTSNGKDGGNEDKYSSCAEAIIGAILYEEILKKDKSVQLIATLNQIADNPAVIEDLGEASGLYNIPEVIKNLTEGKRMYISSFKGTTTGDQYHTIISYTLESLISSLYRIMNTSSAGDDAVVFASSLFNKLGYTSYRGRTKEEKIELLLGSFYDDYKELINEICDVSKNQKEKEEDFFIEKIDDLMFDRFDKYIYINKKLGCLTAMFLYTLYDEKELKEICGKDKKKFIFEKDFTFSKIFNSELYTARLNSQDIIAILDSLIKFDKTIQESHIKENEKFIKEYKADVSEGKFNISEKNNIFVKTLKALLNNEDLFKSKMKMFYPLLPKRQREESKFKLDSDITLIVYNILSDLIKKGLNSGRSKFIQAIDDIEIGNLIEEMKDTYPELHFYYSLEQEKHRKNSEKKGYKGISFSIKNRIRYILREVINCTYNICYCLLTTSDKRIIEGDGILKTAKGNEPVWEINSIFDRKYDIKDGILQIEEEKVIIC